MTVEADLYGTLNGIVPTYPLIAPDGAAPPYCVYQRVSSTQNNNLESGNAGLEKIRYQIDIHASRAIEARSLAAQVKNALGALTAVGQKGCIVDDRDLYEPDVKLFRAMLDWECWAAWP